MRVGAEEGRFLRGPRHRLVPAPLSVQSLVGVLALFVLLIATDLGVTAELVR